MKSILSMDKVHSTDKILLKQVHHLICSPNVNTHAVNIFCVELFVVIQSNSFLCYPTRNCEAHVHGAAKHFSFSIKKSCIHIKIHTIYVQHNKIETDFVRANCTSKHTLEFTWCQLSQFFYDFPDYCNMFAVIC